MKKRWLRFLLLGVGAYFLFLIATFPAAYAYKVVKENLKGVSLSGIDGSIWSGSAYQLRAGKMHLQEIQWRLNPWPLMLGRVELKLAGRDEGTDFRVLVGRTLGGEIYFRGLNGEMPVGTLQRMTPYSVPALEGELLFENVKMGLAEGRIVEAEGVVFWQEAAVKVGAPVKLGNFSLELQTENEKIVGEIRDAGGPLQAEGYLNLAPEGAYQLKIVLTPRESDGVLAKRLRILGSPDVNGSYTLQYSGNLAIPAL